VRACRLRWPQSRWSNRRPPEAPQGFIDRTDRVAAVVEGFVPGSPLGLLGLGDSALSAFLVISTEAASRSAARGADCISDRSWLIGTEWRASSRGSERPSTHADCHWSLSAKPTPGILDELKPAPLFPYRLVDGAPNRADKT